MSLEEISDSETVEKGWFNEVRDIIQEGDVALGGGDGVDYGIFINALNRGDFNRDGTTEDGPAFQSLIDHVNGVSGSDPILVWVPPGTYVITGNTLDVTGTVEGLPAVTRDNVHWWMYGAELKVPSTYDWQRTQEGGGDQDQFARSLNLSGQGCKVFGGVFNGNLTNRTINRGDSPSGFGGTEHGLFARANDVELINVRCVEWGTDGLNVQGKNINVIDSAFHRNRRLGVSVTGTDGGNTRESAVRFYDCRWNENASSTYYSSDEYNNPAAGFDNEGASTGVVVIDGGEALGNRKRSMFISTGAQDCIVKNHHMDAELNFQPKHNGGHLFQDCRVDAKVFMNGDTGNSKTVFMGCYINSFDTSSSDPPATPDLIECHIDTPQRATGKAAFYGTTFSTRQDQLTNGDLDAGESTTVDFSTIFDDGTFLVICKMNNGDGSYDADGTYVMTFNDGSFEGGATLKETSGGGGRSITRTDDQVKFDNPDFASSYGYITREVGGGEWGT